MTSRADALTILKTKKAAFRAAFFFVTDSIDPRITSVIR
jgi:hypothetical protein